MKVSFEIADNHKIESANYVTNVVPMLHPDRVLEVHDFLYILDGTWEIYENDTAYEMGKDDLLILSAGNHHYGKKPSSAGNKHMYIHLYQENHKRSTSKRAGSTDIPSTALTSNSPLFHCASNPRIKQYFKEIIATHLSDNPSINQELKEEKISLLMGLMLWEINSLQSASETKPKHSELISKIIDLLQTNPHHMYTTEEIADKFYVCSKTISNMFKDAYDATFYSYQMNMKLEMVRQYLSDHPYETLASAARNYGFYDEFHLGKAFKKKYGYSPKRKI
ncbi:AraC-type DNA-binding protein [Butyrivibrio sp. INlla18]|uniref:AraC family transcriptional regulator n=1 Tax=Butyrivibrio sp. INlla18 TaxID=1520806 RepID=UPI000888C1FD|nr:AraC family transcriptional regulator [Butyrivibrio sp. INlla18]SDA62033.1 AraC-type DNA-binding protein [Butyrivibrio sp. INlla18]